MIVIPLPVLILLILAHSRQPVSVFDMASDGCDPGRRREVSRVSDRGPEARRTEDFLTATKGRKENPPALRRPSLAVDERQFAAVVDFEGKRRAATYWDHDPMGVI